MRKYLKFVLIFVISYFLFDFVFEYFGIEQRLHNYIGTIGGTIGVVLYWCVKCHVFCCIIPAAITYTVKCKCHNKCEHKHGEVK